MTVHYYILVASKSKSKIQVWFLNFNPQGSDGSLSRPQWAQLSAAERATQAAASSKGFWATAAREKNSLYP